VHRTLFKNILTPCKEYLKDHIVPEVLQISYKIKALLLYVPTSLELRHCGLLSVQEICVIFIDKLHNNNYQSFASVFCIMAKVISST
jgi:hypothetical protein